MAPHKNFCDCGRMITSRIVLADPFGGPDTLDLVIPLSEGYGDTPELAHKTPVLIATAERPGPAGPYQAPA